MCRLQLYLGHYPALPPDDLTSSTVCLYMVQRVTSDGMLGKLPDVVLLSADNTPVLSL